jgi:hypothetical protein
VKIILVLFVIFAQPTPPQVAQKEVQSLEVCLKAAAAFLAQSPKDFGATSIAAACEIKQVGDPA